MTTEREDITRKNIQERLKDPNYLPTIAEIKQAFPVIETSRGWDDEGWNEWHGFCHDKNNPVFEFFNREYIGALSNYLSQRVEELGGSVENPLTILEIGAGNGKLTHFLNQKLDQHAQGKFRIVATDWGNWGIERRFPTERMSNHMAIDTFKPTIIITSWMPYRKDWTRLYRPAPSVKEYILIGETDGGSCGADSTWGVSWSTRVKKDFVPEYERDGFVRINLSKLNQFQICRTDHHGYYHSASVSFRRKQILVA